MRDATTMLAEAVPLVAARQDRDLLVELVTDAIRDPSTERDRLCGLVGLVGRLLEAADDGDALLQRVALDLARESR